MRFDARSLALIGGIAFCAGFAVLSLFFAVSGELDAGALILLVISLVINAMILIGLIGAIRNPPDG